MLPSLLLRPRAIYQTLYSLDTKIIDFVCSVIKPYTGSKLYNLINSALKFGQRYDDDHNSNQSNLIYELLK